MNRKPHQQILFRNELAILEGNRKRNIWVLALIIAVSFIGLGHSLGGIRHLKKRMDNPFTKWVNLPIKTADNQQSAELQRYFEEKLHRDSFFLDNVKGYKRDFYTLADKKGTKTYQCIARTIDPQEQLMEEILKPSNIVYSSLSSENELPTDRACWVIMKKDLLEKLGFTDDYKSVNLIEFRNKMPVSDTTDGEFSHYIPLIAVVNDLPDLVDMVVPEHFNELFFLKKDESDFIPRSGTPKIEFLAGREYEREDLEPFIRQDSLQIEDLSTQEFVLYDSTYYLHEVYVTEPLSYDQKFNILRKVTFSDYRAFTTHDCDTREEMSVADPYYLAFNFNDLSRVRLFREKVKRDFQFEISLNQVEDKENFSMVAQLTAILSILLFVLSLVSVLLFLGNLLLSHIEKISANLGTFKAFGLSDQDLISDYNAIVFQFLLRALFRSFILVVIYGLLQVALDGHFYLFDWKALAALIGIVISVNVIVRRIIKRKLRHSPGDLIYNR